MKNGTDTTKTKRLDKPERKTTTSYRLIDKGATKVTPKGDKKTISVQ
jgi:hypothetical protein